ncbi:MAG TPA: hypothetical protein VNC40_05075 [Gaiellaceae bacterium]|nr:hypothetical protein [Gaiellaceae bacterium]
MTMQHASFWVWLLPLAFGSPWLAGSIVLWRYRVRDGSIPPSAADLARTRLWTH